MELLKGISELNIVVAGGNVCAVHEKCDRECIFSGCKRTMNKVIDWYIGLYEKVVFDEKLICYLKKKVDDRLLQFVSVDKRLECRRRLLKIMIDQEWFLE